MGVACGVLGWPPAVFWQSTLHELLAAIDGRASLDPQTAGREDYADFMADMQAAGLV